MNPSGVKAQNNFDFLRLFFSSLVIYSHSFGLLGIENKEPLSFFLRGMSLSSFAVFGFFVISGYFIYQSLINSQSAVQYLKKRFLRIWPGLFVVSVVIVVLLGLFFSTCSFNDYFSNKKVYTYFIKTIFFIPTDNLLPGVFEHNHLAFVNGSLWTLRYEVLCYLSLIPLFVIPKKWYVYFIGFVIGVLFILQSLIIMNKIPISESALKHLSHFVYLTFYFYVGVLWGYCKPFLQQHFKWILASSLFLLVTFSWASDYFWSIAFLLAIPCLILSIGEWKSRMFQLPEKLGDISYGTYIYAYPIQQGLIALGIQNVYVLIVCSLILSWLAGWFSFRFIEKQFIFRYKKQKTN